MNSIKIRILVERAFDELGYDDPNIDTFLSEYGRVIEIDTKQIRPENIVYDNIKRMVYDYIRNLQEETIEHMFKTHVSKRIQDVYDIDTITHKLAVLYMDLKAKYDTEMCKMAIAKLLFIISSSKFGIPKMSDFINDNNMSDDIKDKNVEFYDKINAFIKALPKYLKPTLKMTFSDISILNMLTSSDIHFTYLRHGSGTDAVDMSYVDLVRSNKCIAIVDLSCGDIVYLTREHLDNLKEYLKDNSVFELINEINDDSSYFKEVIEGGVKNDK